MPDLEPEPWAVGSMEMQLPAARGNQEVLQLGCAEQATSLVLYLFSVPKCLELSPAGLPSPGGSFQSFSALLTIKHPSHPGGFPLHDRWGWLSTACENFSPHCAESPPVQTWQMSLFCSLCARRWSPMGGLFQPLSKIPSCFTKSLMCLISVTNT